MGTNDPLNRKLRMALVGGGQGAFIGRVHATAAVLDNRAELVAGALSSNPEKAKASAPDYDIKPDRAYGSVDEMIEKESALPEDQRVDFVSVATPNHTHFPIAKAAVEASFNVMCDKPMTFDLEQAEELGKLVDKSGVVFGVTHNYTGYPLVRQAREMILGGELGEIQAIRSFYIQGWLRARLEQDEHKQAAWRTDPTKSGAAGCFGDIATHAYNLARYMTGELPESISCNLKTFAPGRQLDDYGTAVIRFENGALGTVTASQISHGRENDLFIEIDGTNDPAAERPTAQDLHPRPECAAHQRQRPGRLPVARRSPGGLLRGLRQRLSRRLRQHGAAGRRQKVRGQRHDLSQRERRHRRDVLHPAVRRQQRGQRRLAAFEARPGTAVISDFRFQISDLGSGLGL
jgi:predicted dehydrogenase